MSVGNTVTGLQMTDKSATEVQGPTGLVTLLFTDVVGSTQLWETEPELMSAALLRHDHLLRRAIETNGGFVFKTVGDAFCAAFANAADGVAGALAAQRALAAEAWPGPIAITVRMGLHSGFCEERDRDYFGPVVNRAARLEAAAHGGQIVLSKATAELVVGELPPNATLRDLGKHHLKDLNLPELVFQLEANDLKAEFPPLRSLDNPELGNNLPLQITSFVGRKRERSAIARLVARSRLVTLTGPGGSGKTRLALAVLAEMDGVWYVDLAPVDDPELVPSRAALVLGIKEEPGRPIEETLFDGLQDRTLLIVLDNCEHLIDACAKFADGIIRSCPKVRVVATSREPLDMEGERVFRVPTLSLPAEGESVATTIRRSEAARLFVERAKDHQPEFSLDNANAPLIASICRRLDGIPLAIELAAARVSTLSVDELAQRLDDRFTALAKGHRTAIPRHKTLRALVDWSYDLLVAEERAALRRLSVFAGGFTLDSAKSVCRDRVLNGFDTVELLASLVNKSLVQFEPETEPPRYRLLETIRQFSTEKLVEHQEAEAVQATHARTFLSFAEAAAPHLWKAERMEWRNKLDAERDNIRLAMTTLLAAPATYPEAARLLFALYRYWYISGQFIETKEIGEMLLAHPEASKHNRLWVEIVAALALVWRGRNDDLAGFKPAIADAVDVARELGLHRETALMLLALGRYQWRRGNWAIAEELTDESIGEARAWGDPLSLAICLICAGIKSWSPPDPPANLTEALDCVRSTGDVYWEAEALNNLGYAELLAGNFAHALRLLNDGLVISNPGSEDISRTLLENLGFAALALGDEVTARTAFVESLLRCSRTGTLLVGTADIVAGLALCAAARGELVGAAFLHGATRALLERAGHALDVYEAEVAERGERRLQEQLGDTQYEVAFAEGFGLTPKQVIAEALQRS